MITGYYVMMTRRTRDGDFVTPVLGPFPTLDAVYGAGGNFIQWYRTKFPGDHEAVLEPVSYSAHRLPLGRCNVMYGFYPFTETGIPPLFGG